jgi:hypothetical protein
MRLLQELSQRTNDGPFRFGREKSCRRAVRRKTEENAKASSMLSRLNYFALTRRWNRR